MNSSEFRMLQLRLVVAEFIAKKIQNLRGNWFKLQIIFSFHILLAACMWF